MGERESVTDVWVVGRGLYEEAGSMGTNAAVGAVTPGGAPMDGTGVVGA